MPRHAPFGGMRPSFFPHPSSWLLLLLILLLAPATAPAWTYKQAGYVTNAYFSDDLIHVGEFVQPNAVVNVLPTGDNQTAGYFVLDMVLAKGSHQISVEILDENSRRAGALNFDPVEAPSDYFVFTAAGAVAGDFPSGWLFFKVFDQSDKRNHHLGTFAILARKPPENPPAPEQTGPPPPANPSQVIQGKTVLEGEKSATKPVEKKGP